VTATQAVVDTARAADLDAAHIAWSVLTWRERPTFGEYTIDFLRSRGLIVARDGDGPDAAALLQRGCTSDEVDECDCGGSASCTEQPPIPLAEIFPGYLPGPAWPLPETVQAVAMSVEEIADLLAALAERDLRWTRGENGRCGTLTEGAPEPPNLHVVFDTFYCAWQRYDDRALDDGDERERWFGPNGTRQSWTGLQRGTGPTTPEDGIAPTTGGDES